MLQSVKRTVKLVNEAENDNIISSHSCCSVIFPSSIRTVWLQQEHFNYSQGHNMMYNLCYWKLVAPIAFDYENGFTVRILTEKSLIRLEMPKSLGWHTHLCTHTLKPIKTALPAPYHITIIQIITMQLHDDISVINIWPPFIFTAAVAGDDNSLLGYIMRLCPFHASHLP